MDNRYDVEVAAGAGLLEPAELDLSPELELDVDLSPEPEDDFSEADAPLDEEPEDEPDEELFCDSRLSVR